MSNERREAVRQALVELASFTNPGALMKASLLLAEAIVPEEEPSLDEEEGDPEDDDGFGVTDAEAFRDAMHRLEAKVETIEADRQEERHRTESALSERDMARQERKEAQIVLERQREFLREHLPFVHVKACPDVLMAVKATVGVYIASELACHRMKRELREAQVMARALAKQIRQMQAGEPGPDNEIILQAVAAFPDESEAVRGTTP
jgi:hypothetical protein